MTKVMLVGDCHRNNGFLKQIIDIAIARDVEVIVQLGDFAYDFKDRKFFKNIGRFTETGGTFYFVPGNHDDWDFLDFLVEEYAPDYSPIHMSEFFQPKGHPAEPYTLFPQNLIFLPRSSVVQIGNRTCMGMGGAFSIDKDWRTPHVSYWPGEMLTEADIIRARGVDLPIDTMLTHDIPADTYPFEESLQPMGYKVDAESRGNRERLASIVNIVQPTNLYHGHYHHRHEGLYETPSGWGVKVHGLGADVPDGYPSMGYNYIIEEW